MGPTMAAAGIEVEPVWTELTSATRRLLAGIEFSGPWRNARAMHEGIFRLAKSYGWYAEKEFPCSKYTTLGTKKKGRIDLLLALGDEVVAMELDRWCPRPWSLQKLELLRSPTLRVCVLRKRLTRRWMRNVLVMGVQGQHAEDT